MSNQNPPAFPRPSFFSQEGPADADHVGQPGMELRDYFAGQALIAALAEFYRVGGPGEVWSAHADLASHIYSIADAMLAARQK